MLEAVPAGIGIRRKPEVTSQVHNPEAGLDQPGDHLRALPGRQGHESSLDRLRSERVYGLIAHSRIGPQVRIDIAHHLASRIVSAQERGLQRRMSRQEETGGTQDRNGDRSIRHGVGNYAQER